MGIKKIQKNIILNKKKIIRHITAWSIITIYLDFIDHEEGRLITRIIVPLLSMSGYIFTYYMGYLFIFPKFSQKKYLTGSVSLLLTLTMFETIHYFIYYILIPALGDKNYFDELPVSVMILSAVFPFFFTSMIALGTHQSRLSKLKLKIQVAREKALLVKELGFYKNQFNSHIIFNFLNYCFSHIHKDSKEGADAIEMFSNMLTYTLDSDPNELVSLEREIEHITNYINLQKILYKDIYVNFEVNGDPENNYIVPRILINFIENAFKHGDSESTECPINIRLNSKDNLIELIVSNKKRKSNINKSTGIGNLNVFKQLKLLYKDNYRYNFTEDFDFYSCSLQVINKPIQI
jgi:two-component system LytT family sensor kinase